MRMMRRTQLRRVNHMPNFGGLERSVAEQEEEMSLGSTQNAPGWSTSCRDVEI